MSSNEVEADIFFRGDAERRALHHGSYVEAAGLRSQFSLRPLLEHWRRLAARDGPQSVEAKGLLEAVGRLDWLGRPFEDPVPLLAHRELLTHLLSAVLPTAIGDQVSIGLLRPFALDVLCATRRFRATMLDVPGALEVTEQYRATFEVLQPIAAHLFILEKLYGLQVPALELAYVVSRAEDDAGLERHYQLVLNLDFVEVHPREKLPDISRDTLRHLAHDFSRFEDLYAAVPIDQFVFEGFALVRAIEITLQESVNQLRDAFVNHDLLRALDVAVVERRFRSVLRLPSLHLAMGVREAGMLYFTRPREGTASIIESLEACESDGLETVMRLGSQRAAVRIIDDARNIEFPPDIQRLVGDARSVLVAPLMLDGQWVGVLLLASSQPACFSALIAVKVSSLLPLIARTVKRTHDAVNLQVQAVIKERYTAIHPSVEWRFRRTVFEYLRGGRAEGTLNTDIVFPEVYPLFGVSDIRSSSVIRSRAVQADLLEQLGLALDVMRAATAVEKVAMVDHVTVQLEQMVTRISAGLTSGEEMMVTEFLRRDVEPLLPRLTALGENVHERLARYRDALDPSLGMLYRRRRDFEESLLTIADLIAALLDREQARIQRLFPHYFEMHKTDGVDHGMYVGQSLLTPGQTFDAVFLRSLRLWQLEVMCEAARAAERVRRELRVPLETTHLVLVQHAPLSIRFSTSEKQFNVDGAYNARYEIVKKRLDKAEVRGSRERLTQPRKLAIVYAHPREAEEYRGYLTYLAGRGEIEAAVEELELDELPGVRGLQALRVEVRVDADATFNDETPTCEMVVDTRAQEGQK